MGMREEFEAAACAICLRDAPDCGLTVEEIAESRRGDEYETSMWSFAWWAWQESRATLVLDFTACNVQHASYNNVDCYSINDVKVIAARHGVGVTVK